MLYDFIWQGNASWKSNLYDKIDTQTFFHCGNHYFDEVAKETTNLFCRSPLQSYQDIENYFQYKIILSETSFIL
jgi:hypothetical protein